MKIHHVALTVSNIEKSIEWYQRNLNAEILGRYEKRGSEIVHLRIGDGQIELFEYGDETQLLPNYRKELESDLRTVGTKHVCFEVSNLINIKQQLENNGVEIATEIDTTRFGGNYFFIKDPDGILIELYQA